MPKTRPPYPPEFRQQMIELVNAGRTPAELSREFNVTAQTIANWVSQAARDAGKPLPGKWRPSHRALCLHGTGRGHAVFGAQQPQAIAVNIEMRTFVRLRALAATHGDLAKRLSELEDKSD